MDGTGSTVGPDSGSKSQFDGTDWSNNLFSDLGPLLALFGEQAAKQFMSQSTGWADNIVFAMAQLGIITAVTGAIRVGGPTWLKAVIGRARENRAAAEIELMSSTSHEVCELWNGQQIARIPGPPLHPENLKEEVPGKEAWRLYTLNSVVAKRFLESKCKGISTQAWLETQLMALWAWVTRSKWTQAGKQKRATPYRGPNTPNITFNLYDITKRSELDAVAAFGVIIQLGVLVYSTVGTYYPRWAVGGAPLSQSHYGLPLTVMGTVLLRFGVFICDYAVQSSTTEISWELKPIKLQGGSEEEANLENKAMRLLWIQRSQAVSDRNFDSYVIIAGGQRTRVMSSHRREDNGSDSDGDDGDENDGSDPNTVRSKLQNTDAGQLEKDTPEVTLDIGQMPTRLSWRITVVGALVSICGFIAQFTGSRGMHWSVSVAQLLATLIMSGMRVFVRRRLVRLPIHQGIQPDHEADWLATRLARDEETLWMGPHPDDDTAKSGEFRTEYSYKWGLVSGMDLEIYKAMETTKSEPPTLEESPMHLSDIHSDTNVQPQQPNSTNQRSNDNDQITSKQKDHTATSTDQCASKILVDHECAASTAKVVVSASDIDHVIDNWVKTRAYQTVQARVHLREMIGWTGHMHDRAVSVASAIEIVINHLFKSDTKALELTWPLRALEGEIIPLKISREGINGRWKCEVAEIEAVLSLWMFSTAEARDRKDHTNSRSKVGDQKQNLRLLGPSKPSSYWLLKRWIGGGVMEITPATIGTTPEESPQVFKKYRVVGFTGNRQLESNMSMSQEECKFIMNRGRPLAELNFQCGGLDTSDPLVSATGIDPDAAMGSGLTEGPAGRAQAEAISPSRPSPLLAVSSNVPLDMLFAQDLFSSFMFALASIINPIEDDIKIRTPVGPDGTHTHFPDHGEAWKSFELESPCLARIASEIECLKGLGSVHDVYVSIIPALAHASKLPVAHCMIDLAQQKSRDPECRLAELNDNDTESVCESVFSRQAGGTALSSYAGYPRTTRSVDIGQWVLIENTIVDILAFNKHLPETLSVAKERLPFQQIRDQLIHAIGRFGKELQYIPDANLLWRDLSWILRRRAQNIGTSLLEKLETNFPRASGETKHVVYDARLLEMLATRHKGNLLAKKKVRDCLNKTVPDEYTRASYESSDETSDDQVFGRLFIDMTIQLLSSEELMQIFAEKLNESFRANKIQLLKFTDQHIDLHSGTVLAPLIETNSLKTETHMNMTSGSSGSERYPSLVASLQLTSTDVSSSGSSTVLDWPSIRVYTPRTGWFNRHKMMVERHCNIPIIWWPLAAPIYPGTKTVSFSCVCGGTITDVVPSERLESTTAFFRELHVHYSTLAASSQVANMQLNGSPHSQQAAGSASSMANLSASSLPHRGLNPNHNIVNIQVPGAGPVLGPRMAEPAAYVLFYLRRWLHCIDLPLIQTRSDRVFFELLRNTYHSQRGWLEDVFSLRKIKTLQFTKFQRIYQYIESSCEEYCDPPSNAGHKYQPDNSQRPIISPGAMMHFFNHPHHAAGGVPTQYLITQIPKRLDGPKPNEEHFAWGITAIEGISCFRIIIWSFLVLLLGAVGGGVFVTWWLKGHPGDLQNAFIPIFGVLALVPMVFCVSQFVQSVGVMGREKMD